MANNKKTTKSRRFICHNQILVFYWIQINFPAKQIILRDVLEDSQLFISIYQRQSLLKRKLFLLILILILFFYFLLQNLLKLWGGFNNSFNSTVSVFYFLKIYTLYLHWNLNVFKGNTYVFIISAFIYPSNSITN